MSQSRAARPTSLMQRLEPDIGRHLLRDEGEVIVDVVAKHWVAYLRPAVEVVLALALLVAFPFIQLDLAWFPFLLALLLAVHAGWKGLAAHLDRFVVTNMRVFRLHGVLNRRMATVPAAPDGSPQFGDHWIATMIELGPMRDIGSATTHLPAGQLHRGEYFNAA